MKTGKLKKKYEERVNHRKPKANKICKVHKGKHIYDIVVKEYDFGLNLVNDFENKLVVKRCECGKKKWCDIPIKSGKKLSSFVSYCKKYNEKDFEQALEDWRNV